VSTRPPGSNPLARPGRPAAAAALCALVSLAAASGRASPPAARPAADSAGEAARLRLATVNGEAITLADIRESFATRHSGHGGLLAGEEIVRSVIEKAIAERLLVQEGHRMGIADEPDVRQAVSVYRDLRLLERLEERFIEAPAEPPEAEVREAFALLPRRLRVAVIEARDRETAEAALGRLTGGEPFDAVARALSTHGSRTRGGDLGFVTWGVLDPPTEEAALGTSPGAITGPFASGGGFRIVKVIEERTGEPPALDEVSPRIRAILRARRREALRAGLLAGIRRAHPPAEDAAASARLLRPPRDAHGAPDPPDAAVLLRTATGLEVTAGRVRERARKARLSLLEAWRAAADDALLIDEARRRITPDAAIERRVRRFRDERVREEVERTVVLRGLTLTDAEVKAFYDGDPGRFAGPPSYHLRHIVVATRAEAEEVRRALAAGADFAALASRRSIDAASAARGGDLGWTEASRAAAGGAPEEGIAALAAGGISGIIESARGYSLVQVLETRPGAILPFEAARHDAARRLMIRKQQALRDAYVHRLRERSAVRIFEAAVRRAVSLQDEAGGRRPGAAPDPAARATR
jgi:parvulin-like peptidyl-prolyl isomerase